MKSPLILSLALGSLLFSGVAVAQDGGLGKKGNGKSSGSSQDRGSGRSSGSSSTPPTRGSSDQGRDSGLGRPERASGGSQNRGGTTTPPLGRPERTSGGSQNRGGTTTPPLGRPERTSGGSQNRGGTTTPPLGRPERTSGGSQNRGNTGSGSLGGGRTQSSGAAGTGTVQGRSDRVNGSSGSGTILGRPDRGTVSNGNIIGKNDRVGSNNHNVVRDRIQPGTIFDVPSVSSNRRITREGGREDRISVGGRYRDGYCHYDNGWNDSRFWFPYYGYTWYPGNTVCSPFYYYYHLPAYVNIIRVSIGPLTWVHCSTPYVWNPPRYDRYGYYESRYADLDYAIDDIRRAFEREDIRSMTRLIPTRGRVEIDMATDNQYSLDGADFYDLMRDLVEGTRTTDYRIVDVYREGGRANVEAIHEYTDPWGREERVRHIYGLREGSRGYEIRYFRTDR